MSSPELHSSIVALVSLASGIASNHPAMGQCQLAKLRHMGISEEQIATVVEIARHIRDEASQKLDHAFNEKSALALAEQTADAEAIAATPSAEGEACCSSTASGQACC